jgi:CDP-diglyceride synthetase
MKFIPRKAHIIADILIILALLIYPWIFIKEPRGVETLVLMGTGVTMLCYSLLTKYEIGIAKTINMTVHLSIDFFVGLFLVVSPWLLNFGEKVLWPYVIMGCVIMLLSVTSSNKSIEIGKQEEAITF